MRASIEPTPGSRRLPADRFRAIVRGEYPDDTRYAVCKHEHVDEGSAERCASTLMAQVTRRHADSRPDGECRSCGHAAHWRECRAKTVGVISGDAVPCECRHRGPSGIPREMVNMGHVAHEEGDARTRW
jgi:hypothetical protein